MQEAASNTTMSLWNLRGVLGPNRNDASPLKLYSGAFCEPESIIEEIIENRVAAAGGVFADELRHGTDEEAHGEGGGLG